MKAMISGLRLKLEKLRQDTHSELVGRFVLILLDGEKSEVMRFVLPKEIEDDIRASNEDMEPMMSPDGMVSIGDKVTEHNSQLTVIALDKLIARDISPAMLENEQEAIHMLSEFRTRLLKSLELVDQAIASLPKP